MKVFIQKRIYQLLRYHDGHSKAVAQFVECCANDRHPPRIYKPSGIARDGTRFEPYLELHLWHHHLSRLSDPLLVVQQFPDEIRSVALANHQEYFYGDKMAWLQRHADDIEWAGCESLHEKVLAYQPLP